jgi:hypothetical protein
MVGTLRHLAVITLCTSALISSCSSRQLLKTPHKIEDYNLHFGESGIEPAEYGDLSEQEWWESFFQDFLEIDASNLGYYFHLERDTELELLADLIKSKGDQFFSDQVGVVMYLTLGNNSEPLADISYFRLLEVRSLLAYRQLELLIEKGVEVDWEDICKKMKVEYSLDGGKEEQGTFWLLYRFKVSRLIGDPKGLFNRAFTLSCDKYYFLTAIDGTRRMLLAERKRRYEDLIIPESAGHRKIQTVFESAVVAYNAHYR